MGRDTYRDLVILFPALSPRNVRRDSVAQGKHMLMGVWWAAHGEAFRVLGERFE